MTLQEVITFIKVGKFGSGTGLVGRVMKSSVCCVLVLKCQLLFRCAVAGWNIRHDRYLLNEKVNQTRLPEKENIQGERFGRLIWL